MEKSLKQHLPNGQFENVSLRLSKQMAAIKGKSNKSTELKLRASLISNAIKGWKVNVKDYPGKPDFLFIDRKVAIFVDGCFWHGCPKCGHIPQKNSKFWAEKIKRNKARDRKNTIALKRMGFKIMRFWEHDLKKDLPLCVEKVIRAISTSS